MPAPRALRQLTRGEITDQLLSNVVKGAAWLDETEPGWYLKISRAVLDMASGVTCVCGQIFAAKTALLRSEVVGEPQFVDGQILNGYDYAITKFGGTFTQSRGFDCLYGHDTFSQQEQYSLLAEAWIVQVEKRLADDGLMA